LKLGNTTRLTPYHYAQVPAFIVKGLDDERFTVFVSSVPTPFAGAVYILGRNACISSTFLSPRPSSPFRAGGQARKSW
jgi:hypothetical protein